MKLVLGNWKMHGSVALLHAFAAAHRRDAPACEAALCLPHPLLPAAQAVLGGTGLRWGGQDCSSEPDGPFTGEVPARLLVEFGARYVIVGHSERRAGHGETDGQVAAKARRALAAGITPVVCIGESAEERDGEQTVAVLRRQLLQLVRTLGREVAAVVLAYEPVWAVGRTEAAAPGLIDDTLAAIAEMLAFHAGLSPDAVRILYGGSVHPRNAGAILSRRGIAGVLVGGASLRPEDFIEICKAAQRCSATPARPAAPNTSFREVTRTAARATRGAGKTGDDDVHPGR